MNSRSWRRMSRIFAGHGECCGRRCRSARCGFGQRRNWRHECGLWLRFRLAGAQMSRDRMELLGYACGTHAGRAGFLVNLVMLEVMRCVLRIVDRGFNDCMLIVQHAERLPDIPLQNTCE